MLSEFALKMNSDPKYREFPIVAFPGYHQRQMGCFGAGNRYVYVDPNGNIHACPFCRGKIDNILELPFANILEKARKIGCHQFTSVI
jgi:MoaA/NifB/PqqE/SkfB family radical SAM enzyme